MDGCPTFLDDRDYRFFLGTLERIKRETESMTFAHCLMPNHFHLAIKVRRVPLAFIMQRILTSYANTFNRRHDRMGHLFQGRHKAKLVGDDRYLAGLIHYIQQNPVRAGLVARAEDWPWSSRSPVDLSAIDEKAFDPWAVDEVKPPALLRAAAAESEALSDIATNVGSLLGIDPNALHTSAKSRKIVRAKELFAVEGIRQGHRIADVARWLGAGQGAVARYLRKNSTNVRA